MIMASLFWDVDTQADFMQPTGKLYVPGAEKIVPNLQRLTESAAANGVLIISSACAHQEGDAEFAEYPPHCLAGTPGQLKIAETRLENAFVLPNHRIELPRDIARYQQIIVEKQQFNAFTNPNLEELLKRIGEVREVVLYGVVTEICVAWAGRELLRRGYRITVVSDAIHQLDSRKANAFLDEVASLGGRLDTTADVTVRVAARRAA